MSTAHGITRVSLAKVGGRHLSDSSNAPNFDALVDAAMHDDKLADGYAKRRDAEAMRLQHAADMRDQWRPI